MSKLREKYKGIFSRLIVVPRRTKCVLVFAANDVTSLEVRARKS